MPENGSHEELKRLNARLDALERMLREQSERLRALELLLPRNREAATRTEVPKPHFDSSNQIRSSEQSDTAPSSFETPSNQTAKEHLPEKSKPPLAPQSAISSNAQAEAARAEPLKSAEGVSRAAKSEIGPPPSAPSENFKYANRTAFAPENKRTERTARAVDLESRIGGRWFNWIGTLAVCFAVAFFLKYAFENNWIGAMGRVLLGGAGGIALLIGAQRLHARGYVSYAHVLTGGGILILYLSVYAAFGFYQLVGQLPAFLLMSAVTVTAVLLAARHDALSIAILGLIGGFLTPLLLSTGTDNELGLFTYIALLDAGVLALAHLKSWRSLNYLAFVSTVLLFAGWLVVWYAPPKLWLTCFFLTLFFLLFAALAVLHNLLPRRLANWLDLALVAANASLYFGSSYMLLNTSGHHPLLGSFALALSAFYALLFYAAHRVNRKDRALRLAYLNAAIIFFTLAIAIQLNQYWMTIGWAVEACALSYLGLRGETRAARYGALAVFLVALAHWFMFDMPDFAFRTRGNATGNFVKFTPLLNARAFSCAVLIASFFAAAWLYKRARENSINPDTEDIAADRAELDTFRIIFLLAANALIVILLSVDTNDYFTQAKTLAGGNLPFISSPWGRLDAIENARQFSFTVIWALCGAGLYIFGIMRRIFALRAAAALLLMLAILKTFLLDLDFYAASWHAPLINQTFFAFVLLAAALACIAAFYERNQSLIKSNDAPLIADEPAVLVPTLIAVASLLLLVGLSAETLGYFDRAQNLIAANFSEEIARLENHKQFALSAVWTICASIAFYFGIARRLAALRYFALALLGVTSVKIVFTDAKFYDAAWHLPFFNPTFAAFALFVAALLFVRWLYLRDAAEGVALEEKQFVQTLILLVGNLFALVALSLEASGYFNAQTRAAQASLAGRNLARGAGDDALRNLKLAKELSLSVIWAIYGGALLGVGFWRRNELLRRLAIGLLGVTTLKVFFLDLASLDRIYRIISFFVLGVILLVVSFLYQQSQHKERAKSQ